MKTKLIVLLTVTLTFAGLVIDWRAAVGAARAQSSVVLDELNVHFSEVTGHARFVIPKRGTMALSAQKDASRAKPIDFLTQYGYLFGVKAPAAELVETPTVTDDLGYRHTIYSQVYNGVPVFSGMVKVHQDNQGDFAAANGNFYSIPTGFNTTPGLDGVVAAGTAMKAISADSPTVEHSGLVIVDPGWYGDPSIGPHLAYYIIVADSEAGVREGFFIDAHSGAILDRWSMIESALNRNIHDARFTTVLPGVRVRAEGEAPRPDIPEADQAYDYVADIYDYYSRGFNRDSYDDRGSVIRVTVRSGIRPDGFWTGPPRNQIVFFPGLGLVTDDFVGHELTHGVTQFSAGLIYQNQSGQLNESFSDVFGELMDLFNGSGPFAGPRGQGPNLPLWPLRPERVTGPGRDDGNQRRGAGCSPPPGFPDGVRWLIFEDTNRGGARDMWNPPCFNHPDRVNSPLYVCGIPQDNGGVHIGSGVPNHAFAILTDGKNFNGQNVNGIGPIKAAAVWYRALTVYLTPASNFQDAFIAFNRAAADLVGTRPRDPRTGALGDVFTVADAQEVDRALRAVEMNVPVACGPAARNYIYLVDTTGSAAGVNQFYNALINFITQRLDAIPGPDQFAIARFDDYPCLPHGEAGDVPYQLITPFVQANQIPAFLPVVGPFRGADVPESQIDAIVTALTGRALVPAVGGCGPGVPAGQGANPAGAVRGPTAVILLTTPPLFHLPGPGKPHVNGPADVVGALVRRIAGTASGFEEGALSVLVSIQFGTDASPVPGPDETNFAMLLAAILDAGGSGAGFQGVTGDEDCIAFRLCQFLGGGSDCGDDPCPADPNPPECFLSGFNPGPPASIEVTVQDSGSGLAAINVLTADNIRDVDLVAPFFNVGTNAPVVITFTKVDQSEPARVEIEVIDAAGNVTICDPVLIGISRETGEPVSYTIQGIPQAEHKVTVRNGNPGLTNLRITVNGHRFQAAGLRDNEVRTIDVSSAMVPGNNTITLRALGRPGGSAAVLIHD